MSDTITVNTSTTNITLSVFSQPNNINVNVVEAGAIWGSINGTLSNQTDLWSVLQQVSGSNGSSGDAGVNTLVHNTSANWNTAYNIATAYSSISGTFATNTLLQRTSALLTPLTLTNTLTSLLVTNTAFSNYQTNVAASTATLLPTSVYQSTSGSFATNTALNAASGLLVLTTTVNTLTGLLTPLTTTNTLTGLLVKTTDLNILSATLLTRTDANTLSSLLTLTTTTNTLTGLLTPLTVTNNLTGLLVKTTDLNTLSSLLVTNTTLNNLSGNWQSTYVTVSSLSANWNTAYVTSTAYSSVSSTFATNTTVNTLTGLLTPLTTTNTLTGLLVKTTDLNTLSATLLTRTDANTLSSLLVTNTAFSNYQTSVGSATATLLPTSVYQSASSSFITAVSGTANQINASKTGSTVTLSFPNSAIFPGNVTILGNLSAQGTATFANTIFTTTSALCAIANSNGPALYIAQRGSGDLASFYDLSPTPVEVLHIGASVGIPGVGIYTSTPNKELTVVGEISATKIIYASGGNSNQWNTAYNTSTAYQSASSSFATKSTLSNYLPLSGGTLTGGLTGTTVKANTFYGVQGTNSTYGNEDGYVTGFGGACGCILLNGGNGDTNDSLRFANGGSGGCIDLRGGNGNAGEPLNGGNGGCIIMVGSSFSRDSSHPAGSINTSASSNYRGGNIITACGGDIITSGDNGNNGGSIITCGCGSAGGSINTSGSSNGDGGSIFTCNRGGNICTTGSDYFVGGYINTSSSDYNGGYINTSGGNNGNGGYIDTGGNGDNPGGYITTRGGGYINTSDNGQGNVGGYINTSGDGNGGIGGNINTSAGLGGVGGYIKTSSGGGSINTTGSGYIQFGYNTQRTTLSGTATSNQTILLPNNSGTIALISDTVNYLPLSGGTLTGSISSLSLVTTNTVSTSSLRIGNSTTVSTALSSSKTSRRIQIFDQSGNSLGYIPVYATI